MESYVDLGSRIHCIYIREVVLLKGHRLQVFAGTEYKYLTTQWLLPRGVKGAQRSTMPGQDVDRKINPNAKAEATEHYFSLACPVYTPEPLFTKLSLT